MTSRRWSLFIAALMVAATSLEASPKNDAEAAIRAANAKLKENVLAGNVDAVVTDFYATGAVIMPPNAPSVTGDANVKAVWKGLLALGKITLDVAADEVRQTDDTAVEAGKWTIQIEAPGVAAAHDNGKYIVLWKRLPDGKWRATRDMWSSDNPPQK